MGYTPLPTTVPVQTYPATISSSSPGFSSVTNSVIPGMPSLTKSASDIVRNLLGGMPSTSSARRANAYYGASSGVPGSDFVRNRGFDLYGQQANASRQQGIQDLLAMLAGYSAPALQERGQNLQNQQFNSQLQQRQYEYGQNQQQRTGQQGFNPNNIGVQYPYELKSGAWTF